MKKANNMKELVEMCEDTNWIFRQHEDAFAPPEWAKEIDEDEKFQREMGAREIWGECPYCGTWHKNLSAFCTPQCKQDYIQLKKTEEERTATMKFLRGRK